MDMASAKTELRKGFDPEYSGYLGDIADQGSESATRAAANQRAQEAWAEALDKLISTLSPAPSNAPAAKAAFMAAAAGMDASGAVFSAAVNAHASAILMPGYTPTPPAGTLVPTSSSDVHETMCDDFTTQLLAFYSTGSATLISPPNTVVPWS